MRKWFAALFMLIDHIGYFFAPLLPKPLYLIMRSIGRLAFPIFAYYIAVGFRRTKNVARYFLRLLVFATITEFIFTYAFRLIDMHKSSTNVLFTFIGGLAFLCGWQLITQSSGDVVGRLELLPEGQRLEKNSPFFHVRLSYKGISLPTWLGRTLGIVVIALSLFFVEWIDSDYGAYGVLFVFAFYLVTDEYQESNMLRMQRALGLVIAVNILSFLVYRYLLPNGFGQLQFLSILAVPLIFQPRFADKRATTIERYFFYIFYPAHVFLLAIILYFVNH